MMDPGIKVLRYGGMISFIHPFSGERTKVRSVEKYFRSVYEHDKMPDGWATLYEHDLLTWHNRPTVSELEEFLNKQLEKTKANFVISVIEKVNPRLSGIGFLYKLIPVAVKGRKRLLDI